jgi:hypothetical protein
VARLRRLRSVSATLAKVVVGLVALLLAIVVLGLLVVETGWAKNCIRI